MTQLRPRTGLHLVGQAAGMRDAGTIKNASDLEPASTAGNILILQYGGHTSSGMPCMSACLFALVNKLAVPLPLQPVAMC